MGFPSASLAPPRSLSLVPAGEHPLGTIRTSLKRGWMIRAVSPPCSAWPHPSEAPVRPGCEPSLWLMYSRVILRWLPMPRCLPRPLGAEVGAGTLPHPGPRSQGEARVGLSCRGGGSGHEQEGLPLPVCTGNWAFPLLPGIRRRQQGGEGPGSQSRGARWRNGGKQGC